MRDGARCRSRPRGARIRATAGAEQAVRGVHLHPGGPKLPSGGPWESGRSPRLSLVGDVPLPFFTPASTPYMKVTADALVTDCWMHAARPGVSDRRPLSQGTYRLGSGPAHDMLNGSPLSLLSRVYRVCVCLGKVLYKTEDVTCHHELPASLSS